MGNRTAHLLCRHGETGEMSAGDNSFLDKGQRVWKGFRSTATLKVEDAVDILCKFMKLCLKVKGQSFLNNLFVIS